MILIVSFIIILHCSSYTLNCLWISLAQLYKPPTSSLQSLSTCCLQYLFYVVLHLMLFLTFSIFLPNIQLQHL